MVLGYLAHPEITSKNMLKINIGQSFAVITLIHNPKNSNLQFCGNTNFKFAILWQHKNWNWIFVLPQKKLLTKSFFCVATTLQIRFLCCHKILISKVVAAQSRQNSWFFIPWKEKIRGNSRNFFWDFGEFRWFLVISVVWKNWKTLYRCSEIHFFQIKKTQTSFFLVEIAIDCTLKVHFQALPASSNARQHQLGQSCVPCTCNKQSRCAKKLQSFLISLSMLELTVQWSFHQLPALRLFVCFEKEALYSVKFAENKKELTWYLW